MRAAEAKAGISGNRTSPDEGRIVAAGRALKNFCGFGKLRNAAYGRCTAYGCGLVCRNVGKGGAQDVLVVKGNGRIAHEVGGDGGCGVVFAAKASFKHCQLHALAGKTQQGQHRKKFKVGQIGRGSHEAFMVPTRRQLHFAYVLRDDAAHRDAIRHR